MQQHSFHWLSIIITALWFTAHATDTVSTPVAVFGFGELSSNAEFSSDGKRFVTRGSDGRAFLWDISEGRVIATFDSIKFYDSTRCVALSPDGTKLLTGGGYRDSVAKLWDIPTGACLYKLIGKDRVCSVAFSPDGATAITSGFGFAWIWDVATGSLLKKLPTSTQQRHGAVFSPDGKTLLTAGYQLVYLTNVDNPDTKKTFYLNSFSYRVSCTDFSPDGTKIIAASDEDSLVYLCDVASGDTLSFPAHRKGVNWVGFSPDGTNCVTASIDSTAKLWDLATRKCILTLSGHTAPLISATFSPDGKTILTAAKDNMIRLWDVATGKCLKIIAGHTYDVRSVDFSPDGTQLLMAVDPEYAYIWDVKSVTCLRVLTGHEYTVSSAVWSPDGKKIATGSHDESVKVWDAATGVCLKTYEQNSSSYILSVSWSPDQKKIIAAQQTWDAELWDLATDSVIRKFRGTRYAEFSPDGRSVLTGPVTVRDVTVWDVNSGIPVATAEIDGATFYKAAFLPDGSGIVTASSSTVELWNIPAGKRLKQIDDLSNEIDAFTVAPDGSSFFASAPSTINGTANLGYDVKMWSFSDSSCLRVFKRHIERVQGIDVSPDGRYIVTGSLDRTAKIWSLGDDRIATLPHSRKQVRHAEPVISFAGAVPTFVNVSEPGRPSTLRIFRLNGASVAAVQTDNRAAVPLPSTLAPGVYLYRLTIPGTSAAAASGRFVIR